MDYIVDKRNVIIVLCLRHSVPLTDTSHSHPLSFSITGKQQQQCLNTFTLSNERSYTRSRVCDHLTTKQTSVCF